MKFLMKVGDQLDLNVSYDGGAVDNVAYNAPDGYDNKVSVTSSGIVTALGLGEGVVNVLSGAAIVGTIVFEVLTEAAYAAQQGIRDGSKALVVDADAVVVTPQVVKISPTLDQFYTFGPEGYVFFAGVGPQGQRGTGVGTDGSVAANRYDYLWDGQATSYWFASSGDGTVGYYATVSTTLKQVKIKSTHANLTSRPSQIIVYGSNVEPTNYAGAGYPAYAMNNDTGWTLIGQANVTWGNVVSEDREFTLSNATQFKHYKVKLICNEPYVALAELSLWGTV